jgi:hypothetical protein
MACNNNEGCAFPSNCLKIERKSKLCGSCSRVVVGAKRKAKLAKKEAIYVKRYNENPKATLAERAAIIGCKIPAMYQMHKRCAAKGAIPPYQGTKFHGADGLTVLQRQVVKVIASNPAMSTLEMGKAVGRHFCTIQSTINRLERKGYVSHTPGKKRSYISTHPNYPQQIKLTEIVKPQRTKFTGFEVLGVKGLPSGRNATRRQEPRTQRASINQSTQNTTSVSL